MGNLTKSTFRREILSRRRLLPTTEYEDRNQGFFGNITRFIAWHNIPGIHIFLPITRNREPDTMRLLPYLFDKEIHVGTSKTNFGTKEMSHYALNQTTVFEENRLGIPEPVRARHLTIKEIDWILVPLVAFDRKGNRLGYGGGYYDRLVESHPHLKRVGASLSAPFDHFDFVEPHDAKLNYCVTPYEIMEF